MGLNPIEEVIMLDWKGEAVAVESVKLDPLGVQMLPVTVEKPDHVLGM